MKSTPKKQSNKPLKASIGKGGDKDPAASTKQQQTPRPIVYIAGESPLVEEYALLCAAHHYEVIVSWNEPPAQKPDWKDLTIKSSDKIPEKTAVALELTNTDKALKKENLVRVDSALGPTAPILSTSVTVTATEQATWLRHRHRLVGIGVLPGFSEKGLIEAAGTVYSPKETFTAAIRFLASLGKEMQLVQDRVGMVLPRILCQIINEAAFALQEEIAGPQDIDTAVKLGMNYPFGPLEWAEKIGLKQVAAVITAIHQDLGEERYRPAPLLRQFALTGHWWNG